MMSSLIVPCNSLSEERKCSEVGSHWVGEVCYSWCIY
jgi:hypothetical protein